MDIFTNMKMPYDEYNQLKQQFICSEISRESCGDYSYYDDIEINSKIDYEDKKFVKYLLFNAQLSEEDVQREVEKFVGISYVDIINYIYLAYYKYL